MAEILDGGSMFYELFFDLNIIACIVDSGEITRKV